MDIKSFLNRTGLSQTELARKIGVTQASISYWSSGTNFPSIDIAKKLLFMGMTLSELFDAETEAFVFKDVKGKRVNKRRMSADIVESALSDLVEGKTDKLVDRDTCRQIVRIGLEELFVEKSK